MTEEAIVDGIKHKVVRSHHLSGALVDILLHQKGIIETEIFKKKITVYDPTLLRSVLSKAELEQCYTETLRIPYRVCRRENR